MAGIPQEDLLNASVHFGHLKKKWNPKMLPYIFMERKGIHIIDLYKTNQAVIRAGEAMKKIARSGRKILFVATKKQAKDIVAKAARSVGMPFVTERWLGGMLTNFVTIRKSIKKMQHIEKLLTEEGATGLTKKERLVMTREKDKLERVLGGIADVNRLPAALYIVDITHEHIALAEAKKLNLSTFAMVDTNSDPTTVDFAVPANDDASKSVAVITNYLVSQIQDGLAMREKDGADYGAASGQGQAGGEDDGKDGNKRRRRRRGGRRRKRDDNNSGGNGGGNE